MRQGTIRVRQSLPPGIDITDKQIQESLWHYYYDVEKSVSYLASTHTPKAQKASKKATGKKNTGGFNFLLLDVRLDPRANLRQACLEVGFHSYD